MQARHVFWRLVSPRPPASLSFGVKRLQHTMKNCAYCGKENDDDAVYCRECGTDGFKKLVSEDKLSEPVTSEPEFVSTRLEFLTPSPQEMEMSVVNLARSRTLGEADLLVAQLEAAGIPAFIPDQFLMQNIGFNLNTYGYVRIQVSPKDYEAAKALLLGAGPSRTTQPEG
jgi:hypothetical protein